MNHAQVGHVGAAGARTRSASRSTAATAPGGYDDSTHGWPLFGGQQIWDFVESL